MQLSGIVPLGSIPSTTIKDKKKLTDSTYHPPNTHCIQDLAKDIFKNTSSYSNESQK